MARRSGLGKGLSALIPTEVVGDSACTACGGGHFSHRRRGDTGRQALVVWNGAGGVRTGP